MRRRIEVAADGIRIVATINTAGRTLVREEVERLRDQLADRLQEAAAGLVFLGTPRNRVRVK